MICFLAGVLVGVTLAWLTVIGGICWGLAATRDYSRHMDPKNYRSR